MKTKTCTTCIIEKSLSEFYKQKQGYLGVTSECKVCARIRVQKWREANPEKALKCQSKWAKENPELNRRRIEKWRKANHEKILEYRRKYYKKNINKVIENVKKWRKENPDKIRASYRKWKIEHPEKARECSERWKRNNYEKALLTRRKRQKERRKTEPKFKLNCNISRSIWASLKNNKNGKNGKHWEDLVGYTLNDLKKHLEKQFTDGMTWNNYGRWHIDQKKMLTIQVLCGI